MLMDKSVIRVR